MRKFGYGSLWVGLILLAGGLSRASADSFSLDGVEFAKAKTATAATMTDMTLVKLSADSGFWAGIYAGYDYAIIGELADSQKSLYDAAVSAEGDSGKVDADHSGILGGVKVGYDLDKSNSIFVSAEGVWTSTQGIEITSGPDTGTVEKFDPTLLDFNLNYSLVVIDQPGSKTTVSVGGGLYLASTHYTVLAGGDTLLADFGQANIGGNLGISEALSLGGNLDLGFSARFRIADFNKLTGNKINVDGTDSTSGAPYVLVNAGSTEGVIPVPTSATLPPGVHDVDLDYTGFNGDVSLTLRL